MQDPATTSVPLPPYQTSAFTIKTSVFLFAALIVSKLAISWLLPPPQSLASDLTVDNILSGVNRERQLRSLLTLNTNQMLSLAAQSKTNDMIARHYFSHTDPEGNYIWPKIEAAGYKPYSQLGENLAIEFTNTESLVSAWMNSPTHRANVLNEGFVDQGMGLSFGDTSLGQYRSAVANTFGTLLVTHKQPVSPSPEPPVLSAATPSATTQKTPVAASPKTTQPKPVTTKPAATTAPATTPAFAQATDTVSLTRQPLAVRGNEGQSPDFATAQHLTPSSTASSAPALQAAMPTRTQKLTDSINSAQAGRYVTLAIGFLLLLLLLSDLKISLQKNLQKLDKKINNIILLIMAIIVVALMYWL
jgi:uncharacterized protein YkwD